MKRIRIEDSETESASDDGSGAEGKQGKAMPIYEIVSTEDNDSLVRTFRRIRDPESDRMHSPDSTQDGDDPNQRKVIMIPPAPSSSSSSSSSESEEPEELRSSTLNSLAADTTTLHKPNCPYRRLSQARNNLLTDGDVKSALTSGYMTRYMRNGTGLSLGKAMVSAASRSNNALATGPIRDYLDSQRRITSNPTNWGFGRCKCPLSNKLQDGIISSSESQASTSSGARDDNSPGCSYFAISAESRDEFVSTSGASGRATSSNGENTETSESSQFSFQADIYDSDSDD